MNPPSLNINLTHLWSNYSILPKTAKLSLPQTVLKIQYLRHRDPQDCIVTRVSVFKNDGFDFFDNKILDLLRRCNNVYMISYVSDAFGGNQNVSILSDSSPSRNSQITVRVTNHDSPASTEKISPDSKSRGSNLYSITQTSSPSNAAPNSAPTAAQPQSQTLSDLKKQRSMSRVKQHSPSQPENSSSNNGKNQSTPNGPHSKAANISRGNDSIGGQSITVNSAVTFHSQNTDSPTTLLKTSSSRNSSKKNSTSRKSKAKAPTHPKSVAKNAHSSNSSSKHQHENTDNINVDPSTSNHRSPKKAGSRSSTNVKKYSAGTNEVVGPPQKKTGCCKIM